MIEFVTTSGTFSLDGPAFGVDNNIWIVGDGLGVMAVIAAHGHNGHSNTARSLADILDAPVRLHPDDLMLWHDVFPDPLSDGYLADGMTVSAGSQPRGHAASPERDAPAGEVPTGGSRIPPSNPAPNQGAAEGRASMRTAPPDEGPADRDAIDPGGDAAPAAVPSPGMVRHR
ncbi:MAG TPA: hypothetical protein VII19_05160 [Acidimicrobiales bacterium]|nr:hypothetical protein [Acidimicrobiales bacterium]